MKPGLSLRVSQHLALTPQLQQSIRLLQLSTLELAQEVEQMLDDNPFLELASDDGTHEPEIHEAQQPIDNATYSEAASADAEGAGAENDAETPAVAEPSDWDGDGSMDAAVEDGEWGSDGVAPASGAHDGDDTEASELARSHESLTDFLHRQALSLRLSDVDMAALRFSSSR